MSLLSVTVKKARYVGIPATQFNTYATLKLQNVKSTTVTVKGPTPCWEQDFLFEINDVNLGLLVEVWNKGVIWDRALGYHYLPLATVAYDEESGGRWIELEAQLVMRNGAVVGTNGPTGHALLLDCRFEPPFDAEGTGGADLQRKLDLLNGALDAERAEQARRQMQYITHSGYSEDSDYTSDLNYPVGQHPNCSASQFRNAAHQMHTPQRSLEASRENSYERDEYHLHGDTDPLYYNSQPRSNRMDTWSQLQQASVESAISWRTATDWQSAEDQRRPSLERQNTLYDDMGYGYDYTNMHIRDHAQISKQQSYEEYYDSTSYPYQSSYIGDDSKQWDSGGQYFFDDGYAEYDSSSHKRRSSVIQLPQVPSKQLPVSSRYSDFNGMAPYRPRQRRVAASLPATPSSTPKRGRALPMPPGASSLTGRGSRRRLPRPPSNSASFLPHVPYRPEPQKTIPDTSYGYDSFGLQSAYQDSTNDYQDPNYNNTSYDDDGMHPFFDETPHATPPAATATHKLPWSETELTTTQLPYSAGIDNVNISTRTLPTTITTYLPQPPIMSHKEQYQDSNYQYNHESYGLQQDDYVQQDYKIDTLQTQYDTTAVENQTPYHLDSLQYQLQNQTQQPYFPHQHQHVQQHHQQQQVKQPAQQLQTTMMTGAATLGSLMAGGAKKLGSFFGAAAAAVAPPSMSQPSAKFPHSASMATLSQVLPPSTHFTTASTTIPVVSSVPEALPPVSVVSSSTTVSSVPVTLPQTPTLRRQESIQRPTVRRTRTLPEAPDDLPPSGLEKSAYNDDYNNKTEYDEHFDHDRTSLNRYDEENYASELHEDVDDINTRHLPEESSVSKQKVASPTRNGVQLRKPSVDSYHSVPSYPHDEPPLKPTTEEEIPVEKSKVTFQEDRTTYHEAPQETDEYGDHYHNRNGAYRDDSEQYHDDEQFTEDNEKFEQDEGNFNESDDAYQDETQRIEHEPFQEEQPKLTPRQRWHRAYNKIVMQLNVSNFNFSMEE